MWIKIIGTVFGVLTIISSGVGILLSTDNYMSYMMIFLGATILSLGVDEIYNQRNFFKGFLFGAISICIFVSLV
ncbi:DUF3953 domain-containing protein [Alkalihalobacterium bogoriense]|uniref:DUF3953 domain-containing protein n=1 Tax=Alkalihalobacterium bogoriense TaxID=246272 RepID=UPI00047DE714|nr:DUF3953 domain-containing protein [Alkalihalobacterium bogoriense]